jgi:hypothetical protein
MIGAQSSTTHSNYAEEKLPSAELKLYPTRTSTSSTSIPAASTR